METCRLDHSKRHKSYEATLEDPRHASRVLVMCHKLSKLKVNINVLYFYDNG